MTRLQLDLLGWPAVKVTLAEGEITPQFASNKVQAILFYLAVTGQPCARDTLIGLLWPETSQKKARVSLRSALYNLQQQLPGVLTITRKSVTIAPECQVELDTAVFSQGVSSDDSEQVRQALTLYRGDFLEGFYIDDAPEFDYWRVVERERLRQLVLAGLEQLADYDESRGETAVARKSLRRLLALEPWRETIHRRVMLLLARSGDYNGAIQQYQQCCAILDEELGVLPMPETEALYQRILVLRQRPPQLNLPVPPPDLVGREPELARLAEMLADPACRLIAITGMGGIGKSSLALALAGRQARHFLDGVYFVSLAELDDDGLLDTAVARVLGLEMPPHLPPRDALSAHLQEKELLLILDSTEHVQTAVEALIQALLAAAPALKLIVASRHTPRLQAANVLPLVGLSLPEAGEALADAPAVALFARCARRVRPDFSLETAGEDAANLCRLLAGSPLGIELAAAQLDVTNCADLAAELRIGIEGLTVSYQDMPARHRSLRALFNHSWRQLAADEQAALARLSVFRGGFTLDAAVTVTQTGRETLTALARKSLLYEQDGRFSLHVLIRQFAREQLPAGAAAADRHARYYSRQLSRQDAAALTAESDNVRAMWHYAVSRADASLLAESAHHLARFYAVTNQFAAGRVLFGQAVDVLAETEIPQRETAVWGEILGRYAMFLLRAGQLAEASEAAERSVAALRGTDDEASLAFSLNLLGVLRLQSGAFAEAVIILHECAALYRRLNDPAHLLKPLINLGSGHLRLGQYEASLACLNEAFPLAEEAGDRRGMTHVLNNLGAVYLALGDLTAARDKFSLCLPLAEETASHLVRAAALQNMAEIAYQQGDLAQAIALSEESLALTTELENETQAIRTRKIYALALHAAGKRAAAWMQVRQAVQCGYEMDALPALLDVLTGAGTLLLVEGETAAAVDLLRFVCTHPATERQYVVAAQALLAQAGAAFDAEGVERPLAEVVTAVLQQCNT